MQKFSKCYKNTNMLYRRVRGKRGYEIEALKKILSPRSVVKEAIS